MLTNARGDQDKQSPLCFRPFLSNTPRLRTFPLRLFRNGTAAVCGKSLRICMGLARQLNTIQAIIELTELPFEPFDIIYLLIFIKIFNGSASFFKPAIGVKCFVLCACGDFLFCCCIKLSPQSSTTVKIMSTLSCSTSFFCL